MIAEDCEKLKKQLEEVAKANERQKVVHQLNGPLPELLTLRDKVVSTNESLELLKKRTQVVGTIDGSKALGRVRQLREVLAADAGSLTKGSNLRYTKSAFEKLEEQITKAKQDTWEQYQAKARPVADSNQLGQAEQQEAYKKDVAQLKSKIKFAEQAGNRAPTTEEAFVELENTWNEIREAIEKLPVASEDPDVKTFLRAVNTREGEAAELLTDAVRSWLDENKSSTKYRIHHT